MHVCELAVGFIGLPSKVQGREHSLQGRVWIKIRAQDLLPLTLNPRPPCLMQTWTRGCRDRGALTCCPSVGKGREMKGSWKMIP